MFIDLLKHIHVKLPDTDVLQRIPKYSNYLKDIVGYKSRLAKYETVALTEECISRIQNKFPTKKKDPGSFTVQITIGTCINPRGMCDMGACINLIPTSIFRKMALANPKPTSIL